MNDNTFENNSFFDEYGLLHVEKGVFSENGVLFAAEYWTATKHLDSFNYEFKPIKLISNVYKYDSEAEQYWFDPNPSHNNDLSSHFSHDNMTGLYCLAYFTSFDLKNLPILLWNCVKPEKQGRWYYKLQKKLFGTYLWPHPRDFFFYLTLKHNILGYLGLPLVFLTSLVSAFAPRDNTSGKCKWFLRYLTLAKHRNKLISLFGKISLRIFGKILEKEHGKQPFLDVFRIYFVLYEHPMHDKVKDLYAKGILKA